MPSTDMRTILFEKKKDIYIYRTGVKNLFQALQENVFQENVFQVNKLTGVH